MESGGGIYFNGNYLSHEKEAYKWFLDHKAKICIFVDTVFLLHAIGAIVVHTFEYTWTR